MMEADRNMQEHFNVNFKYVLVLSKTNKYMHQLVKINIYIKMYGATIKIQLLTFTKHKTYKL